MPNESAAPPPALPPELSLDFDRFLEALRAPSRMRSGSSEAIEPRHEVLDRPDALELWRRYGALLYERSAALALVAKGDRDSVFTRHILDSLNPISLFPKSPERIVDIGSGGGLPGIPLAVAWPETRVTLMESRERKAGFLEQVVRTLGLGNVDVVCARLESEGGGGPSLDRPVDAVFVRAVDLATVLEPAVQVLKPGGRWVYFLGSREAGDVVPAAAAYSVEVREGAFGGRLLIGVKAGA